MDSALSKSALKRRAKGIEALVTELASLSQREIASLPCDQDLQHEIALAKNLKGGARKRQLKHATKLLRTRSAEELYDFMARKKGSLLQAKREFQELEHFRNLLISEAIQRVDAQVDPEDFADGQGLSEALDNSEIVRTIVTRLPEIDSAQLKNTAIQFARTRNRKFSRELFRIMKAAADKAQFSQQQEKK